MSKVFQQPITFSFHQADVAGVVFFAHIITAAHVALEDLSRESGIGWANWFQNPELKIPLRKIESEFLLPIFAGKALTVQILVEKLGDSSVRFRSDFVDSRGLCASIKSVHVFASAKGEKIAIPAHFRNALEPYLGD